jgi:hypothetical protein
MSNDPERLLAEALRARATNAPAAAPSAPQHEPPTPPVVETPGGYGLLSGAGEGSLERERAALEELERHSAASPEPAEDDFVTGERAGQPLSARWVLLLALSLGLATGSVIGLLTLL